MFLFRVSKCSNTPLEVQFLQMVEEEKTFPTAAIFFFFFAFFIYNTHEKKTVSVPFRFLIVYRHRIWPIHLIKTFSRIPNLGNVHTIFFGNFLILQN